MPFRMSQMMLRSNPVTHAAFEFLYLREASIGVSRPNGFFIHPHLVHSSGTWLQRDLSDFGREGRQELLRHPRRSQQPTALRAVFDLDSGCSHGSLLALFLNVSGYLCLRRRLT